MQRIDWTTLRVQLAIVTATMLGAMIAVPIFYQHRMNDGLFVVALITFIGIPAFAGSLQKQVHRPITLVAACLLLLCPAVYAITDPLGVQFEKIRDGYFLGTGSSIIFVSTIWGRYSLKPERSIQPITTIVCLLLTAAAVFILLWAIFYFE